MIATIVVVLAATALAVAAFFGWRTYTSSAQAPSDTLVLIGESELEDGTTVAGLVAVITRGEGATLSVTALDTAATTTIPGTSFDRLRDALPLGGPARVAEIAADETAEWVLLNEPTWQGLVDTAGGAELTVPEDTTVFTGEQLFRFDAGAKRFSGAEAGALLLGAEGLGREDQASDIRMALARVVAGAAVSDPGRLGAAMGAGIESSLESEALVAWFGG